MDNNVVAALVMIMLFIGIIVLLAIVPSVITTWQLYGKAGKPGWTSIIPVYSTIIMAEIGNKPMWMGVAVGASSIASSVFDLIGSSDSAVKMLFSFLSGIVGIVTFVLAILLLIGFIKAYQANTSFWICYFLVPIVAVFMVKNVTYRGINSTPNFQSFPQPTGPQFPIAASQYSSPQQTQAVSPQFQQQVPQQPVNNQPPTTNGPFEQR